MSPRARGWLLAGMLLTGPEGVVVTGCGGPTCETSCERVFYTCGFDYEEQGNDTADHVRACVEACRTALEIPSREEEAVTWMQCVETYPCETLPEDPNGFELRETCPPDDYYLGDLTAE